MPRWTKDEETGYDTAGFGIRVTLDRAQYAIVRAFQRDNPGKEFRECLAICTALGIEQLGLTYDPRRRKI